MAPDVAPDIKLDLIKQACESCRRRKLKCTKSLPKCEKCQSHNWNCCYTPKIVRTPLTRQQLTEMEVRCWKLDKLVARLVTDQSVDELLLTIPDPTEEDFVRKNSGSGKPKYLLHDGEIITLQPDQRITDYLNQLNIPTINKPGSASSNTSGNNNPNMTNKDPSHKRSKSSIIDFQKDNTTRPADPQFQQQSFQPSSHSAGNPLDDICVDRRASSSFLDPSNHVPNQPSNNNLKIKSEEGPELLNSDSETNVSSHNNEREKDYYADDIRPSMDSHSSDFILVDPLYGFDWEEEIVSKILRINENTPKSLANGTILEGSQQPKSQSNIKKTRKPSLSSSTPTKKNNFLVNNSLIYSRSRSISGAATSSQQAASSSRNRKFPVRSKSQEFRKAPTTYSSADISDGMAALNLNPEGKGYYGMASSAETVRNLNMKYESLRNVQKESKLERVVTDNLTNNNYGNENQENIANTADTSKKSKRNSIRPSISSSPISLEKDSTINASIASVAQALPYHESDSSDNSNFSLMQNINDGHIDQLENTVLTAQKASEYVKSYFEIYHTSYPFLHAKTFMTHFNDPSSLAPHQVKAFEILKLTICALGCWCASDKDSIVDLQIYAIARHKLGNYVFEHGNIFVTLALVLLSNYIQKRDFPNTGWAYLGTAVRHALGLALHETIKGASPLEQEIRNRIWWGLYIFDVGTAITWGRPIQLPNVDEIRIECVRNIPDEIWDEYDASLGPDHDNNKNLKLSQDRNFPTLYSGFIAQVKFTHISSRIYNRTLSKKKLTLAECLKLNNEIEEFSKALPSYLSLDGKIFQQYITSHYHKSMKPPNWLYLTRYRLLWRVKNLQNVLFKSVLLYKKGPLFMKSDPIEVFHSICLCLDSSRETIESVTEYNHICELNRLAAWYAIYFSFHAVVIPMYCLLREPHSKFVNQWLHDLQFLRIMLVQYSSQSALCDKFVKLIDRSTEEYHILILNHHNNSSSGNKNKSRKNSPMNDNDGDDETMFGMQNTGFKKPVFNNAFSFNGKSTGSSTRGANSLEDRKSSKRKHSFDNALDPTAGMNVLPINIIELRKRNSGIFKRGTGSRASSGSISVSNGPVSNGDVNTVMVGKNNEAVTITKNEPTDQFGDAIFRPVHDASVQQPQQTPHPSLMSQGQAIPIQQHHQTATHIHTSNPQGSQLPSQSHQFSTPQYQGLPQQVPQQIPFLNSMVTPPHYVPVQMSVPMMNNQVRLQQPNPQLHHQAQQQMNLQAQASMIHSTSNETANANNNNNNNNNNQRRESAVGNISSTYLAPQPPNQGFSRKGSVSAQPMQPMQLQNLGIQATVHQVPQSAPPQMVTSAIDPTTAMPPPTAPAQTMLTMSQGDMTMGGMMGGMIPRGQQLGYSGSSASLSSNAGSTISTQLSTLGDGEKVGDNLMMSEFNSRGYVGGIDGSEQNRQQHQQQQQPIQQQQQQPIQQVQPQLVSQMEHQIPQPQTLPPPPQQQQQQQPHHHHHQQQQQQQQQQQLMQNGMHQLQAPPSSMSYNSNTQQAYNTLHVLFENENVDFLNYSYALNIQDFGELDFSNGGGYDFNSNGRNPGM